MRQISNLDKEEKLIELTLDIQTKQSMGQILGSQNPMYISDDEVKDLLEDVIDDIWYITTHPNFLLENRTLPTLNYKVETKQDINNIFKQNKNKIFIWYNITTLSYLSLTNKPSYLLRGNFFDNRQNIRNDKINEILDK